MNSYEINYKEKDERISGKYFTTTVKKVIIKIYKERGGVNDAFHGTCQKN